jgi:hypothetical protein
MHVCGLDNGNMIFGGGEAAPPQLKSGVRKNRASRQHSLKLEKVLVAADLSTVVIGPFVAHVLGFDPRLYDIG